jgi:hypothetical protein
MELTREVQLRLNVEVVEARASRANHHARGVDGQQLLLRNMVREDGDNIFF